MPDGLSDEAQSEWRRVIPILSEMGVLTVADGATIAGYCQSFADWIGAQADIREHGRLVKEPITSRTTGEIIGYRLKKNPAITIASEQKKAYRAFAADLGLSPAARTRVHARPTDDKSDNEDDVDRLLGDDGTED
jgi:P27 family predicted phage terminase small subunit